MLSAQVSLLSPVPHTGGETAVILKEAITFEQVVIFIISSSHFGIILVYFVLFTQTTTAPLSTGS